jgi:hypothetical protein
MRFVAVFGFGRKQRNDATFCVGIITAMPTMAVTSRRGANRPTHSLQSRHDRAL